MVADAIVAIVIAFATYAFFRWLASAIDFRFTALSIIGLTAYFALWITNNRDLIEVVTHKVPRVLPFILRKPWRTQSRYSYRRPLDHLYLSATLAVAYLHYNAVN